MILKLLTLSHFRCHSKTSEFEFSDRITMITGDNARGKTSLLEALYVASRGRGFREHEEIELLTLGEDQGYVVGSYTVSGGELESSINYVRAGDTLDKRYMLDRTPVGLVRYRKAQVPVVLFAPHQTDIIVHGPSYRREYLNVVLSLTNVHYVKALREYESALRKRNAILEDHTNIKKLQEDLIFWDEYLAERSQVITEARQQYAMFINEDREFAGKRLHIQYIPNNLTVERLQGKFATEAAARRTLIGPQKDDFVISIATDDQDINVHMFASRSQQRLSLLWIKMRELAYVSRELGMRPILLLDDIYSEFDAPNKHVITSLIPHYQTIITAIENVELPREIARSAKEIVL